MVTRPLHKTLALSLVLLLNVFISSPPAVRAGALFQGDLFSPLETGGIPPVIGINRELVRKVEELGLDVEVLVGVHAGVVPWRTFRGAVGSKD